MALFLGLEAVELLQRWLAVAAPGEGEAMSSGVACCAPLLETLHVPALFKHIPTDLTLSSPSRVPSLFWLLAFGCWLKAQWQ